jgi:hypothetical protein
MKTDLTAKITTFCRELGDTTLRDLARKRHQEKLLQRAADALKAGEIGPALEADLDALDAMVRQEYGQGLFVVTRGFTPLPPYPAGTGAQWWTCPRNRCAGRGRVQPGQDPPECAATSEPLVPGPLPE